MQIYLVYSLLINFLAFLFFVVDKRAAMKDLQRIPERILLQLILAGGMVGAFLAMQIFRHKTRKSKFAATLLLSFFVHGGFLFFSQGTFTLQNFFYFLKRML